MYWKLDFHDNELVCRKPWKFDFTRAHQSSKSTELKLILRYDFASK